MEENISESEKKKEDWMNSKWRPAMGWMYMGVCIFDFILAPILWAVIQFWETSAANDAFRQWQPLTLQGAGLFHMAMGAVLGLTAWGRTQEKLNGANNGGVGQALNSITQVSNSPAVAPVSLTAPAAQVQPNAAASAVMAKAPVVDQPAVNDKGKKVVPPAPEPEI